MTYQRRQQGVAATFYPIVKRIDNRGNEHKEVDLATPIPAEIWMFPQRGAKAEVTGQQKINVVKIGSKIEIPGIDIGSRVEFMGRAWDVVTPVSYHHGAKRHTRHYAMDVRERP